MAYLHQGHAPYPIRIGHEWCGVVAESATGRSVMARSSSHRRHDARLRRLRSLPRGPASRVPGPARGRYPRRRTTAHWPNNCPCRRRRCTSFPTPSTRCCGALVEPGGNALRAALAADLNAGDRALVVGPGTIGLLVGDVPSLAGRRGASARPDAPRVPCVRPYCRLHRCLDRGHAPRTCRSTPSSMRPTMPHCPPRALELVEPGKRVVYIGLSGTPSTIDTRDLALKDVTAVGILSASAGLAGQSRSTRRAGRPAAARRSHGRPGAGRRRPRRGAPGRRRARAQDPRRPTTALSSLARLWPAASAGQLTTCSWSSQRTCQTLPSGSVKLPVYRASSSRAGRARGRPPRPPRHQVVDLGAAPRR